MFKKNQRMTATAPLSVEDVQTLHETKKAGAERQMKEKISLLAKTRAKLPELSEELYGTREYSHRGQKFMHVIWFLALVLVAGFEIPTNSGGFEIFQRTQTQTTAMAVAFGIITSILAHFTGHSIKRGVALNKHSDNGDEGSGAIWRGILFFIVAILMFWFIAGFRVAYMHKMGFHQEISQFTQAGFAIGIFFVGAIASFFHTSGVYNLNTEKVFKSHLKTVKDLERDLSNLASQKDKLTEKQLKDVAQAKVNTTKIQADEQKTLEAESKVKKIAYEKAKKAFDEARKDAEAIVADTPNKADLSTDMPYHDALAVMESAIERMEKADHENTVVEIDLAKQSLTNLKNNLN